jgi:hypothetical protein
LRGSQLTFHVELANEGSSAATLHFKDSCQVVPTIQNALGEIVLPTGGEQGCLTVLTQLTLLPGQPFVRDYVWTAGSTTFYLGEPPPLLPAGAYFFSAAVPSDEATLRVTIQVNLK